MTKNVRIENADTSRYPVLVQVWDKGWPEGEPDVLVKETELTHPTALETFGIHSSRYLVIKELPEPPVMR